MVTDELRARLASRKSSVAAEVQVATKIEAAELHSLSQRARAWRDLMPAQIRSLADAAIALRARLTLAGVPEEYDESALYPNNGEHVAACIALVRCVETLEDTTQQLNALVSLQTNLRPNGRLRFAVGAAAAAADAGALLNCCTDRQLAENILYASSQEEVAASIALGNEQLKASSPPLINECSAPMLFSPPPPPPLPSSGAAIVPKTSDWRTRQLEKQRNILKARIAARAAVIGSDNAGNLVVNALEAVGRAALAATRDALSCSLDSFDAHIQAAPSSKDHFDQSDIRAWNCLDNLREALNANKQARAQPLWGEVGISHTDVRLTRQARLAERYLEQEISLRRDELESKGVPCEIQDVELTPNPLKPEEEQELEELRRVRHHNGWGLFSPVIAEASLERLKPTSVVTRVHHKIIVDDETDDALRLVTPADGDVIEHRRPPIRCRRTTTASMPACDSDSEDYDDAKDQTILDSDSGQYE